jgi:hypothetical protein
LLGAAWPGGSAIFPFFISDAENTGGQISLGDIFRYQPIEQFVSYKYRHPLVSFIDR